MEVIFWLSIAAVFYVYAGYPLFLYGLARALARPASKQPIEPFVSVLVAAYNEAAVIAEKVRNTLALDYPADKLEVVVASDGSRDATAALAREAAAGDPRVRVFDYP